VEITSDEGLIVEYNKAEVPISEFICIGYIGVPLTVSVCAYPPQQGIICAYLDSKLESSSGDIGGHSVGLQEYIACDGPHETLRAIRTGVRMRRYCLVYVYVYVYVHVYGRSGI
jgi:hypothetical protein